MKTVRVSKIPDRYLDRLLRYPIGTSDPLSIGQQSVRYEHAANLKMRGPIN